MRLKSTLKSKPKNMFAIDWYINSDRLAKQMDTDRAIFSLQIDHLNLHFTLCIACCDND